MTMNRIDIPSNPARHTDPETSKKAAKRVKIKLGTRRYEVFRVFADCYPTPVSNEGIYKSFPELPEDSVRPRVAELRKAGYLVESGKVNGRFGCEIMTWTLSRTGIARAVALGLLK